LKKLLLLLFSELEERYFKISFSRQQLLKMATNFQPFSELSMLASY